MSEHTPFGTPSPGTPASKRIAQEHAFVLHSYDWSESSLILEVFGRTQGRVTLLAKGAKKPASNFRPVLLPMQRLLLAWSVGAHAEIGTLKSAEWLGGHTMPQGDALLAGFYASELLLKLLAREDAHPRLFDAYATCVALLAMQGKPQAAQAALAQLDDSAPALRAFELLLLRELGYLPALDYSSCGQSLHSLLERDSAYSAELLAEQGLRLHSTAHGDTPTLPLPFWLQVQQALAHEEPVSAVVSLLVALPQPEKNSLRKQLRQVLDAHLRSPLRTRVFMHNVQSFLQT